VCQRSLIDLFVKDVPGAKDGFKLYFSGSPFPNVQVILSKIREEYEGNWYRWDATGQEGWLCPALFKYFENAPEKIYCKVEAQLASSRPAPG
jgi:hypothetical protein